MAKPEHGILSNFSGKIGPVVGVNNRGNFYMRSAPGNRTKFSDKELINQAKFKLVQDHLRPLKELLKVGFKDYFTKTGGFRAAFAYTRKHSLAEDGTSFYIDPALFKISGGNLAPAVAPTMALETENKLLITWDAQVQGDGHHADQLLVLLYDGKNYLEHSYIFNGPFRNQGSFEIIIPNDLKDKTLDVYIGFIAADRSRQSESQYLGRIELAVH